MSKDSTIYTYRLLKRVHYKPILFQVYWILTVSLFIGAAIAISFASLPAGLIGVPAGVIGIPLVQTLLLRLLLRTKEKHAPQAWSWSSRLPWFGYAPETYIAMTKVRRLHFHVLWIVLVLLGCLYPWLSPSLLGFLVFVHLWLLIPRLIIIFLLRKHSSSGYLKINENDSSCYAQ
ncbi:hypothetical protein ABEX47_32530 [Paenibacillus ehimensis]|uniref:hypothetical protein n=1 Tax=Paenibacillus ehimensis TaxID=79264 RepID=UPI000685BDF7|nr:hypothetical protein [Paenibacillus ehimensis]MEC0211271.1 hypothetical protein [Paenibacillus ehimensis]